MYYNIIMENVNVFDMSLLRDQSFRLTAEKLALRCGIRADLKGFEYIVDAVILFGTETYTRMCEIYSRIGELRRAKEKSVMRAVSYSIANAIDLPSRLSEMVGINIAASDIHNGLIIAYLGKLFRSPALSTYA